MPIPSATAVAPEANADLFVLSDEQILEIEPEPSAAEAPAAAPAASSEGASASQAAQAAPSSENPATPGARPFATTEDVQALAQLYPGGLEQAKTAAERARTLDDFDRAYFGTGAGTPEQVNASRAQLAQQMLRDDPAAFREMVFAGLRALEEAGSGTGANHVPQASPRAATTASAAVAQHAAPLQGHAAQLAGAVPFGDAGAAYATFERAANEELERNVGATIARTIGQALPNLGKDGGSNSAGARSGGVSLRERLGSSVRQDVEAALKGDRQLGEQIAQILASRRFDDTARAQVVRLIGDRAQQLVPSAARRVINDWTGTTLAAHGAKSERTVAASARREVAPAASASNATRAGSPAASRQESGASRQRSVDYRKLSDDQILDL